MKREATATATDLEKYLQIICLMKDLHSEYIKDSYNSRSQMT